MSALLLASWWAYFRGSKNDERFRLLMSMLLFCAVLELLCATGCARTVIVEDGSPMRVGKATGTVLRRIDGDWVESEETKLPEGWYLVPPRFAE